jgi:hypothetical protein
MIPRKYLIPSILLKGYTEFIAENIPQKPTGRPRSNDKLLVVGIYFI